MEFELGDIITLKKPHPCGSKDWEVLRVGAKLGQDAIHTSLLAGAIGLAVIILFMIIVYRIPGLAASIALCIYTMLVLIIINVAGLTFTLPGIAGIILSIGMAVERNHLRAYQGGAWNRQDCTVCNEDWF
mgnify:CR=1 FL=1